MGVTFQSNLLNADNYNYKQSLKPVEDTESGGKAIASNSITRDTGADKEENDHLLRKVQFARTKAEVLGEYLGAMQTAVKDSGSKGFLMYRRVGNLMKTEADFEETEMYKNKKDTDTFVADQMEAMEKKQQEIQEIKDAMKEQQEKNSVSSSEDRNGTAGDKIGVAGDDNKAADNDKNAGIKENQLNMQQKVAQMYKSKDDPQRNPSTQETFRGMI